MDNKLKLFIILVLVLCIPSIYSYQVQDISTSINVRSNGTIEINNQLNVTDINENLLILDIVPVYDLSVKINNTIPNFTYTNSKLEVYIDNYNSSELIVDVTYLTDKFTTKQDDVWNINYYPLFTDVTGIYQIILPLDAEIVNLSSDLQNNNKVNNISVINKRLVINDVNLSSFNIYYKIGNQKLVEDKNNSWILFIIIILIIVVSIFMYVSKKKKLKNKKDKGREDKEKEVNSNEKLLLGLNENEQKIIKLLLVQDGLSQQKVALKLFLPKGTVSRNIQKLEDKGYIEIKKYGVTNKIFLSSLFENKN